MFATAIIDTSAAGDLISTLVSAVQDNIGPILLVLGALIGISIVMAMLDIHQSNKRLDDYGRLWRR